MRDATLAGSYKNDIAGIGRDYTSALNQKQSTSANGDILTIGLGEIASSNQANSSTFSSDHSFLTWAHNGASYVNWSGTNTPDTYFSLSRIYQVQKV
jgi:flagellar basal body L-ring protein FlgH